MSKELINPLQGIIKQAESALPATTGRTERYAQRLRANGPSLLIADVSGSMTSSAWDGKRKIDVLRSAVAEIMADMPATRLIAFASIVRKVDALPEPCGGTALHLALAYAAQYRPSVTLVISDGQPDDEVEALTQAELLTGRIDTLYVGPDGAAQAVDFMRRLALLGCGQNQTADLSRIQPKLYTTMRRLLLGQRS
jgi:hypothetical protein